jgi:hypothetical protein
LRNTKQVHPGTSLRYLSRGDHRGTIIASGELCCDSPVWGSRLSGEEGNSRLFPRRRSRRPQDTKPGAPVLVAAKHVGLHVWPFTRHLSLAAYMARHSQLTTTLFQVQLSVGPAHDGEPNAPSYPMGTQAHGSSVHSCHAAPYRTSPHHSGTKTDYSCEKLSPIAGYILSLPRANGVC